MLSTEIRFGVLTAFAATMMLTACQATDSESEPSVDGEELGEAQQAAQATQGNRPQGNRPQGNTGYGFAGPIKVMKSGATYTVKNTTYPVSNFGWKNGKLTGTYANGVPLPNDGVGVNFQVQPISGAEPPATFRVASKVMDTNDENITARCQHRTNPRDVPLYQVQWFDSTTSTWQNLCQAHPGYVDDGRAVFTKGYWQPGPSSATSRSTYKDDDPSAFGLACWDGVTAKCERWGYREWQTQISPSTESPVQMKSLFVACQRAAMADYCGNSESYTQPGTWIDIWDKHHFVEKIPESVTAVMYAEESSFDEQGYVCLEATRYNTVGFGCAIGCYVDELTGGVQCPFTDDSFASPYSDRDDCDGGPRQQLIYVDTGTQEFCPHGPTLYEDPPRKMDKTCNACTTSVCNAYPSCCEPIAAGGGWTAACAQAAWGMTACLYTPVPPAPTCPAPTGGAVKNDYDGDRRADLAFKDAYGVWRIDYAWNGFGSWDEVHAGYGVDTAVPADYDGDGKFDLSIKGTDGAWLIDYASDGFGTWNAQYSGYGNSTAVPVPADYDGDGKADLAIKGSDGYWLIDYASDGFGVWNAQYSGFGSSTAKPVPADYDGDGKADLSTKDSLGNWRINYASNGFAGGWDATYTGYGGSTAVPVPADYDGDGKADLSTKDSYGVWSINRSNNGFGSGWDAQYSGYGNSSALPVPADLDGDGKADLAIKDSGATWSIDYSIGVFGSWNQIVPLPL